MSLPVVSGYDSTAPDEVVFGASGLAVFTPLVLSGSLGWVQITAPKAAARAACLAVTAYIHLMRPDVPLRDLDARAEAAIRALEGGAASVNVIDELHRVDRKLSARRVPGPGTCRWGERGRVLLRDDPPRAHFLIDVTVLHRVPPAVRDGQLRRLLEVARLPNVALQVVPVCWRPGMPAGSCWPTPRPTPGAASAARSTGTGKAFRRSRPGSLASQLSALVRQSLRHGSGRCFSVTGCRESSAPAGRPTTALSWPAAAAR